MARLRKTVYIFAVKFSYESEWHLDVRDWERDESDELILLETREITFDLPQDWDPTLIQIRALKAQLEKLRATAQAKETEIVEKINNLLCLEMK
jgi:hypothetical protein